MRMKRRDPEKERFWRSTIREALRSGMSIKEFCRRRRIKESSFYRWQRKLKEPGQTRVMSRLGRGKAAGAAQGSFALVSEDPGELTAGIELVLSDGRRLRIGKGADEETLRKVLAAVGSGGC
jgi:transposase-like protein